jgi:hypothetical protein
VGKPWKLANSSSDARTWLCALTSVGVCVMRANSQTAGVTTCDLSYYGYGDEPGIPGTSPCAAGFGLIGIGGWGGRGR